MNFRNARPVYTELWEHGSPSPGSPGRKRAAGRRARESEARGPYLLRAGDGVRVSLHQLLEGDGLRVRGAGDLQAPEDQLGGRRRRQPAPLPLSPAPCTLGPGHTAAEARPGRGGRGPGRTWPWGWRRALLPRSWGTPGYRFRMLNLRLQGERRLSAPLWEGERLHEHVHERLPNFRRSWRAG